MNVNRANGESEFGRKLAQQMKQHDRIDTAGEPDGDALAAQIVRAQERAHRAFSARRFP